MKPHTKCEINPSIEKQVFVMQNMKLKSDSTQIRMQHMTH